MGQGQEEVLRVVVQHRIGQVVVDRAAPGEGGTEELHHMRRTSKVPFVVETMPAVLDRPCHAGGNGRVLGDQEGFRMLFLHRPVHGLHETKSLRIVAIAVLAQKRLVLLLGGKLVVVELPGGIETKAVDVEFLNPVKERGDEETLYLVAGEVEVRSPPGRVSSFRNGALEEIHVVVVQGQPRGIGGEVDQHYIENYADPLAMEGID